ncbi:MAG: hypothetical protein ACLFRX_06300 [Gemmatimonadota bacterium]
MTDQPDERTNIDRRERGDEAAEDAREEYTEYRETRPEKGKPDPEAAREADLQPDETAPEKAEKNRS